MSPTTRWFASGLLGLLGLLLLGMGGWLAFEHQWLQRQGVEVGAEVLRTFSQGRAGRETFGAMLRPVDQPTMELKVLLTRAQYAQLAEGDEVRFAYLPAHPSVYVLGGLDQVRALGGRDLGAIAGGVLLLVLGGVLARPRQRRPRRR